MATNTSKNLTTVYISKENLRDFVIAPVPTPDKMKDYYKAELDLKFLWSMSSEYRFDPDKGTYVISKGILGEKVRETRKELFAELDMFVSNPLRWNNLSAKRKKVFEKYQKALQDVTDQKSFPETVIWPEKPDELK